MFKNVPRSDKSASATRDRYICEFMHLAVVMLDMYVATSPCPPSESLHISDHSNNRYDAIQHNRPNEVLFHWKCLLETCIAGSEANYVREAVNVLDALTSNCVLPPHIKYLAKHYSDEVFDFCSSFSQYLALCSILFAYQYHFGIRNKSSTSGYWVKVGHSCAVFRTFPETCQCPTEAHRVVSLSSL